MNRNITNLIKARNYTISEFMKALDGIVFLLVSAANLHEQHEQNLHGELIRPPSRMDSYSNQ